MDSQKLLALMPRVVVEGVLSTYVNHGEVVLVLIEPRHGGEDDRVSILALFEAAREAMPGPVRVTIERAPPTPY